MQEEALSDVVKPINLLIDATPRGDDVLAACGQLKSDSERQRGSGAVVKI